MLTTILHCLRTKMFLAKCSRPFVTSFSTSTFISSADRSKMSRGSSVSIVSDFDPRQRQRIFSSSFWVQTGSGANPASCPMGTGGPFPGGKGLPGRDADHSPSSSTEVKNE
jgi:hypothetical protein